MSIPHKEFEGRIIISYGFSPNGGINKKDLESVDVFNYNMIDELLENGDIEIVEGELSLSQLKIDDDIYNYVEELDIFMCINLEKYQEFIKLHAIYHKCDICDNLDYLFYHNLEKNWICNNCHHNLI